MPIREKIERIKAILLSWWARLSARQGKVNKRGVTITFIALLVLFGSILLIINLGRVKVGRKATPIPSPSSTPVEEEIFTPSSYATDSAVLSIEENIKKLDKDLVETDLYETGLNPPVLDMEVEFEE